MATKRKAAKSSKSAKKPKAAAKRSGRSAFSVGTNTRRTVKERVAALAEAPLMVCESDKDLQAMLKVLANKDEPVRVRLAALQSLQAASFSVIAFESCRGDYLATLRKIADDPDPELRQRALGLLARENDGFAEKKLIEGLRNPEKALIPPEKALQLLSYDVHSEAYPIAREIVSKPPNDDARREALRLLAADASAAPLFEKLLQDKKELREIRQIAASALHALKPEKLQEHARKILLDKSDYDDIKATSLTALTQFGDEEAIGKDKALLNSVDRLSTGKAPSKYKQSARQFLGKHGR
jgi:HEAT repeat protein